MREFVKTMCCGEKSGTFPPIKLDHLPIDGVHKKRFDRYMDMLMSANSPDYQAFMERIFLGYLLEQGASEKTRRNYRTDVRHFFGWLTASRVHSLIAVNHETLEAYKRSHTDAHIPISTLNRRLSALRMFFRCATKEGWIAENPMEAVLNLTNKPREMNFATTKQVPHTIRLPIEFMEATEAGDTDRGTPEMGALVGNLGGKDAAGPANDELRASQQPIAILALLWIGALISIIYLTAKITEYAYTRQRGTVAGVTTTAPTSRSFSELIHANSALIPVAPIQSNSEPEIEIVPAPSIPEAFVPASGASEASIASSTSPQDPIGANLALHVLGASSIGDQKQAIQFEKDLTLARSLSVLGDTLLSRTTIAGSLLVDGLVTIGPDGVETIGSPLFIQKNRLASLNLMDGALIIDTNGNIQVSGNLNTLGDLTVNGEIHASTISGTFRKLLITNPPISSESGHYVSHATTGTTAIVSDLTQTFIPTAEVTEHSLIYITPLSSTKNKVLYIQKIYPGQGFTVAIDEVIDEDIRFNWWLIN